MGTTTRHVGQLSYNHMMINNENGELKTHHFHASNDYLGNIMFSLRSRDKFMSLVTDIQNQMNSYWGP